MTQYQKILKVMIRGGDRWYFPQDFMQKNLGPCFVGYEASARLSELAKKYPDVFISERDGKYMKRRLDREALKKRIASGRLEKDLRETALIEIEVSEF